MKITLVYTLCINEDEYINEGSETRGKSRQAIISPTSAQHL